MCEQYAEMKSEILTACGKTPDQLWKEFMSIRQESESFRQHGWCLIRAFNRFLKVAEGENSLEDTLVKFVALQGVTPDLCTFLLEHRIAVLTLEEFQKVGIVYQDAHGRPGQGPNARQKLKDEEDMEMHERSLSSTAQMWRISVEETKAKL